MTKIFKFFKFNVNLGKSTKPRPLPTPTGIKLTYFKGLDPKKNSYNSKELNEVFLKASQ